MYSFAQRVDTVVYDEPLYAHYLFQSGSNHPGRQEVLKCQEKNGNNVVKEVILKNRDKISFHKLMTHFLINIDVSFLQKVTNILFIRNPKEIIHSYSKVIPNLTKDDIGVKKQFELYHILDKKPIILDSKYLLINPEKVLKKLCILLDIKFDKNMLKWKKGPIKEDGVWAKYWYKNVHNSTGFIPYNKKDIILDSNLASIEKECREYYLFLTDKSIKI
tara:strand:- start:399 stop:1052 length:654 start_codon:yes stop_codon:yes gene_type:complete